MTTARVPPSARPPVRRRIGARWRRGLGIAAVVLVGLEVAYLAAAHTFLLTPLGPDTINRRPEKLLVSWDSAWSPLPGLVRARGVEVRGQNRQNQWRVGIDRAWLWVDLLRLPRRAFHTGWLRVRGGEFWLRDNAFGVLPEGLPVEALPPIPGLDLPTETPREELSRKDPDRRPWRLLLDGLDVEGLRDLWVGRYRVRGNTSFHGRLDFAIRGKLELDGLELRIEEGELGDGRDTPLATSIALESRLDVEPFDPGKTKPGEILQGTAGAVTVRARIASFGFLDPFLQRAPWLDLGGQGDLDAHIELRDGEIEPGTRLRVEASPLTARLLDHRIEGIGVLEGSSGEGKGESGSASRLDLVFAEFGIHTPGGGVLARGQDLAIRVFTDQRSLVAPEDLRASIDLPPSRIEDLGVLDEYLPRFLVIEDGSGSVAFHLEVDQGASTGAGSVAVALADAVGRFEDNVFRADMQLVADLADVDLGGRSLAVAPARLRFENVALAPSEGGAAWKHVDGWWADLRFEDGRLDFRDGWRARGRLALRMRDSEPVVAAFVERKAYLRWFHSLLEVEDVAGSAVVDLSDEHILVRGLDLEAEHVELAAELRIAERRREGVLFARYRGLSVAIELLPDGRRDWKLFHSRRWFDRRRAELAGP